MDKRLYRSKKDKVIFGVCSGIAEYFNVDPTFIRLLAVVLILLVYPPTGLILYIACAIIIPINPNLRASHDFQKEDNTSEYEGYTSEPAKTRRNNKVIMGLLLIFVGAFLLLRKHLVWLDLDYVWPGVLIIIGIIIILKGRKNESD